MIVIKDNKGNLIGMVKREDLPLSIEEDGKIFYVKKGTKEGSGFYGNGQK